MPSFFMAIGIFIHSILMQKLLLIVMLGWECGTMFFEVLAHLCLHASPLSSVDTNKLDALGIPRRVTTMQLTILQAGRDI